MSSDFDPYRKWLGIPPKDQPPHHYRLLGIELFESDPDVISNAADARMAHVRSFQTGRYSELSQKILNEIAAAKVCLLNPEKKSQYDAQLRVQLAAQGLWAPPAVPVVGGMPAGPNTGQASATPFPQPVFPASPGFPTSGAASGEIQSRGGGETPFSPEETFSVTPPTSGAALSRMLSSRRKSWQGLMVLLLGAVGVVMLVALLIWVLQGGAGIGEVASQGTPQEHTTAKTPKGSPGTPAGPSTKTVPGTTSKPEKPFPKGSSPGRLPGEGKTPSSPVEPSSEKTTPVKEKSSSETPSAPSEKPASGPPESPGSSKPESPQEKENSKEKPPSGTEKEPSEKEPGESEKPSMPEKTAPEEKPVPKVPVPPADQLAAAEQQIRSVLKEDITSADKEGAHRALAEKLLQHARETADQPAAQYMLFQMAAERAARAADGLLLHEAVEGLAQRFEVEARPILVEALEKAANASLTEEMLRSLVQLLQDTVEEMMAEDDYAVADRLGKAAVVAARKGKDSEFIREVASWASKIDRLAQQFVQVREHLDKLAKNPEDAEANLAVGRWYAIQTGQWEKGLPYLAKSSQQELADAARRDVEGPQEAAAQQELGNRWWNLSERAAGEDRLALQGRAVYWYEQALPELTGLSKTTLERRIETYRAALAQKEPARMKKGEYVLFFDGQKTYVAVPNFRYDGTKPLTVEVILTPASADKNATVVGNMTALGGWALGLVDLRRMWQEGVHWAFLFRTQSRRDYPAYAGSYRPVRTGGQRVMLAAVYDGQEVRLYLDGERQRTDSSVRHPHRPGRPVLIIGAAQDENGPPSDFFHGTIEEVRISFTARYTNSFTPPAHLEKDKATELLLHFDAGQGTTIRDAANARRVARIVGGQWVKRENPRP